MLLRILVEALVGEVVRHLAEHGAVAVEDRDLAALVRVCAFEEVGEFLLGTVSVVCAMLLLGQGLAAAAALPFACAGMGVVGTVVPMAVPGVPAQDHSHGHAPVPDDGGADLMDAHCGGHGTGTGQAPAMAL